MMQRESELWNLSSSTTVVNTKKWEWINAYFISNDYFHEPVIFTPKLSTQTFRFCWILWCRHSWPDTAEAPFWCPRSPPHSWRPPPSWKPDWYWEWRGVLSICAKQMSDTTSANLEDIIYVNHMHHMCELWWKANSKSLNKSSEKMSSIIAWFCCKEDLWFSHFSVALSDLYQFTLKTRFEPVDCLPSGFYRMSLVFI